MFHLIYSLQSKELGVAIEIVQNGTLFLLKGQGVIDQTVDRDGVVILISSPNKDYIHRAWANVPTVHRDRENYLDIIKNSMKWFKDTAEDSPYYDFFPNAKV